MTQPHEPYGTPYPPQPPQPGVYGSPAAPPPQSGAYGSPAAPQHPQPQQYGPAGPPYGQPYGAPASPAYGYNAVQPYSAPPQPYPAAGAVTGWQAEHPQYRLVAPGGRLGAVLLDFALAVVTLVIGWLIWTVVVWSRGQTPGKQLLGHVVADVNTGRPAGWGQMFLREFVIRGLLFGFIVNGVTFGVFGIVDACMVFGKDHRTIHDMVAGTVVRYADI
nr:RDD family protein [uncultured Actinoplanes sp.]